MTKYRIKTQETNQNNTPDILVAIRSQIENARLILEAEKEDSPEIENIQRYIEDLKADRDAIVEKIKKAKLENFKTQTTLLLKEFKDSNYLTKLEKALEVKPVPLDKITLVAKPIKKRRVNITPSKINFTRNQ